MQRDVEPQEKEILCRVLSDANWLRRTLQAFVQTSEFKEMYDQESMRISQEKEKTPSGDNEMMKKK